MGIYRLATIVASIIPPITIAIAMTTMSTTKSMNMMKTALLKAVTNNPPTLILMVGFLTPGPILDMIQCLGINQPCRIATVHGTKAWKTKRKKQQSSNKRKKTLCSIRGP